MSVNVVNRKSLDEHGQPVVEGFNKERNKDKALCSLMGILKGICADDKFTEDEFTYLNVWLKNNPLLHGDPDVFDLMELSDDILSDRVIAVDELYDFFQLARDIQNYKAPLIFTPEDQLNELLGLLCGITSDGLLNDLEVDALRQWFEDNENIIWKWPASLVINQLKGALEGGEITESQRFELRDEIMRVTGQEFLDTGSAGDSSMRLYDEEVSEVSFEGRHFCLTGKLSIGPRSVLEQLIVERGGLVRKTVVKRLDYLVIGDLASRDWRFSSHGRKIQKVMDLKEKGVQISVVPESIVHNAQV